MSGVRKVKTTNGFVLDELSCAAGWVAGTSGYMLRVGVAFSTTEAGVQRVPQCFVEACENEQGRPGAVVHTEAWPFPTDRFTTMEALVLDLIYRLERRLEVSQ